MSTLQGSGALLLWLDVAAELDRETDGWYIDEHMPERIDIGGYHRARRFRALEGAPTYLTMFEADTPDALASAGYLQLVGKISEQSQRIRAGFSNVVRNTFAVRASVGRGVGTMLGSLRLCPSQPHAAARAIGELDAWVPQWMSEHGIVGVHSLQAAPEVRAKMDAVRAVGHSDATTGHVLLIEATRESDVSALRDGSLSDEALAAMGWHVEAYGLYSLLYEVSDAKPAHEAPLGHRA